uniref:Uncharacterized protein n=1 Tax=Rhizophora mucronata TaxID=61149 RepID=A0A2P2LRV5_RHIMU
MHFTWQFYNAQNLIFESCSL